MSVEYPEEVWRFRRLNDEAQQRGHVIVVRGDGPTHLPYCIGCRVDVETIDREQLRVCPKRIVFKPLGRSPAEARA